MRVSLFQFISRWGLEEFVKPLILTLTTIPRARITNIRVHSFELTYLKFHHISVIVNRKINGIKEEKTNYVIEL